MTRSLELLIKKARHFLSVFGYDKINKRMAQVYHTFCGNISGEMHLNANLGFITDSCDMFSLESL